MVGEEFVLFYGFQFAVVQYCWIFFGRVEVFNVYIFKRNVNLGAGKFDFQKKVFRDFFSCVFWKVSIGFLIQREENVVGIKIYFFLEIYSQRE